MPQPATQTHQRWQIDFKTRIHLKGGQTVQLHDVCDPFSGAHIAAQLYRSGRTTIRVPMEEVRATLRQSFTLWQTLPDEVQTDGESTLVGRADDDFPTSFTLWLVGLGVKHRVIPPARPTYNGAVERDHRTTHDYAIYGQTDLTPEQLQQELDGALHDLNHLYPSRAKGCGGKPPLQAHPELLQPRRSYHPDLERSLFSLPRVDAFLSQLTFTRKVSKNGQITLGGRHAYYSVGRAYAQQTVEVHFDPQDRSFVCLAPNNQGEICEVARRPARGVSVDELVGPACLKTRPVPLQLPLPLSFVGSQC